MIKNRSFIMFVISSMILSACFGPLPSVQDQGAPNQPIVQMDTPTQDAGQSASLEATPIVEEQYSHGDAEHHSDVDLTHLKIGDGMISSNPQAGYLYSCMTQFNSNAPSRAGSWVNGDGTWDATKKSITDGSLTWPHSFTITIQGDQRVFQSNDFPDHATGQYSLQEQSIAFSVPANPGVARQPTCVGGEVGIMLSGVAIFSGFDAEGRDALVHELQDNCSGHPQQTGFYHYHSLSNCFEDTATGHSALMGYAFDGFGIHGYYGEDGGEVTNEDLDACHGHTHLIEWDGQMVEMYHYHATHEFPYVVGCFTGEPAVRALSAPGPGGGQQGQDQAGGTQPQGGQGNGGQPPQEAIDACAGLSQNASCSVGPMTGTCQMPPGMTQLACVPQGGPPGP